MLSQYHEALVPIYGASEARAITKEVFRHKFGLDAYQLEQRRKDSLLKADKGDLEATLTRLKRGEPLQYVLGSIAFMGLELSVDSNVLIPRPETEELVHRIIESGIQPDRIMDIGTGSGCIALALKCAFPNAKVIGSDVSVRALEVARSNAARNGVDVEFVISDVLRSNEAFPEHVDLIVSNPPYIPYAEKHTLSAHVRDHEPGLALFVDSADPLLFYRRIAERAMKALRPGGSIWFEGHHIYALAVGILLTELGFRSVNVAEDLSGSPRFVSAHL